MSPPTPEPRKILFVATATDFGGTENFLLQLLTRLDRSLFAPTVCSLRPPGWVGEQIAKLGIPVLDLGMSEHAKIHQLLAGSLHLRRWIEDLEIDLVQSLLYRANLLSTIAVWLSRRRPRLVSGQRSLIPQRARLATFAVRRTRRFADRVVAVSEAVGREVEAADHVDPAKVVVIANGVDAQIFQPGPADELRASWGLAPDALAIGAVGRLSHTKGLHHLLDAVARLRTRGLEVHLVLAGSGPEQAALEAQARRAGLERRVHWLGFQSELGEIYRALDIYALPSLAEGSPNALLEAMACAAPSVASAVGGVPEIVQDGVSGLLVPPGDPAALAAALGRLAESPELRRTLGAAARHRVEASFTIDHMVRQYEELYLELMDAGRPG